MAVWQSDSMKRNYGGFTFTRSFDGEGFAPMAGKIWGSYGPDKQPGVSVTNSLFRHDF